MNKPILIVAAVVVLTLIALFLFNPSINGLFTSTSKGASPNVKMATFAVCEQIDNQSYCRDKIFASCNGTLIEVNGSEFYCLGKKYEVANISLGETIQPENWTDERGKGFITGWATSD